MCMFSVNLSVPLTVPPVSVVPVIDGQIISLNISVNENFCIHLLNLVRLIID
uniref:Uncharacterized protein n=1 Tax=Amphimedon queenslandica TaxID=400682 RepID=A0A1X7UT86_AMPQE